MPNRLSFSLPSGAQAIFDSNKRKGIKHYGYIFEITGGQLYSDCYRTDEYTTENTSALWKPFTCKSYFYEKFDDTQSVSMLCLTPFLFLRSSVALPSSMTVFKIVSHFSLTCLIYFSVFHSTYFRVQVSLTVRLHLTHGINTVNLYFVHEMPFTSWISHEQNLI